MPKKIAIVGSRSFSDYDFLKRTILELYPELDIIIYSGGCPDGADNLAEKFAEEYGLKDTMVIIRPEWYVNGKLDRGAGMKRNPLIIEPCEEVVAFFDGSSPGTTNSISHARRMNKILHIIKV